jgi:microcompartment protein CcmK/EutM
MIIGEVVGTVIASRKTDNMEGLALRIVRRWTPDAQPTDSYLVAVDAVGADPGEIVMVTSGSAARQTPATDNRPVDAIIMAIVDTWHTGGHVRYNKATASEPA